MYCYVWNYLVRPEYVQEFRAAYGPDGDWVELFRRDPEYLRTSLLADCDDPCRFMTIDYWTTREACEYFRERYSKEFAALDQRCGQCTTAETHIGDFTVA